MLEPITPKIQTLLAFDFGTKRIGIATGQRRTGSSNGLTCIPAKDGIPNWEMLDAIVKEWQPDAFVVGLPINMDGTASDMSRRANKFSNRLHGRYGKPSYTVDERLSTFEAKQEAKARGHKGHYKSDPVDELAASIILQSWLEQFPLVPENILD